MRETAWNPTLFAKCAKRMGHPAKSSPAFLFVWTLHVLGVTGMFSLILSVRGLWSLRRGQPR
jgi:hypothetical protein